MGLVNLQYLMLSGNRLQEIRADMWQGLDFLTALSLNRVSINTFLPGTYSKNSKTKISLSRYE